MARHRDDEDFGSASDHPVFQPLKQQATLQLTLCPARLIKSTESVDVDLSDLDFNPPDSSRVKTRPIPEEELTKHLEAAFGHAQIRALRDGHVSVNIVDEVALNDRFK